MSRYLRQLDVLDQPRLSDTPITIIGAGAIGSFTALALAKCGAEHITVYDPDIVAEHNLSNQWYRVCDVGRKKVDALKELIAEVTGTSIEGVCELFVDQPCSEVTICAVDSMDTRIALWGCLHPRPELYIDARMGAEVGKVFCVGPASQWYGDTLHTSAEAYHAPCTARATMYCASGLASIISSQVAQHVSQRPTRPQLTIDFRNMILC